MAPQPHTCARSAPAHPTAVEHGPARRLTQALTAVLLGLTAMACATPTPPPSTADAEVGEVRAGSRVLKGYLPRESLPNSLSLLPPAPAAGSAQATADEAHHRSTRHLRDSPRGALAREDANYIYPEAGQVFACALGVDIDAKRTPHLATLMRRSMTDAGLATYKAKDHYQRVRPFVQYKEATCDPAGEARLLKDGAYPSGHAALGWVWGMVLASLAPDRADAVLTRAYAYGDSRLVCGVHWASDVAAGRTVGAATYAMLQSDATFQAQQQLAREELKTLRKNGPTTTKDCAAEAAALSLK